MKPAAATQKPVVQASTDMTLQEMANSMEDAEDIDFFNHTPITDHTERGNEEFMARVAAGEAWDATLIVKPTWHGKGNGSSGCKKFPGICIIIVFVAGEDQGAEMVQVECKAKDGRLFLYFPSGVASYFGVTSDGYLPVGVDLPIPDDILTELGIHHSATEVKAGIYTANYNSGEGRYHGVVLDLIEK